VSLKTKINPLRPEQVWQPKIGGQFGNGNALKTGAHTEPVRAWRKRVADWRRRVRVALAAVPNEQQ
jgi:hypothetical protein